MFGIDCCVFVVVLFGVIIGVFYDLVVWIGEVFLIMVIWYIKFVFV